MTTLAALLLALVPHASPAVPDPVQAPADAASELAALKSRIADERRTWRAIWLDATSDEERTALREEFPLEPFVGELRALAERAKGTDVATKAWLEVHGLAVLVDDRETWALAVERLTTACVASPLLAPFALDLAYGAPDWGVATAEEALRRILAGSEDRVVRATALSQLALLVGTDPALGEAGRTEALALLDTLRAELGGSDFLGGMTADEFAEGARFEIEHLREGAVAPDFELPDQHGKKLRLSDYRGQVVLLDFWGFV